MTGPEIMAAFARWRGVETCDRFPLSVYPLHLGAPHAGTWYVRERVPGTRVWRAEEDGSFVLVDLAELDKAKDKAVWDRHGVMVQARRNRQRF